MIKFNSIDNLERDRDQSGLYDLFVTTFIENKTVLVYGYKVQRGEEMRIDKICNSIYKKTDYLSFLLSLNNIMNPLTIKAGDLIIYVKEEDIAKFTAFTGDNTKLRERVLNKVISDKKQKIDKSRKDYIQKRKSVDPLPPNIKQNSTSPMTITENGLIKIIIDKDQSLRSKNSK